MAAPWSTRPPRQTNRRRGRSDLYSLGLILYETYTGKRPYEARSRGELLRLHREEPPEVLQHRAEELIERWLPSVSDTPNEAFGWKTQTIHIDHVRSTADDPLRWQRLSEDRFSAFAFFYRRSLHPLNPSDGYVMPRPDDPPLRWPSGVRIELDPEGRLLAWWAIPDRNAGDDEVVTWDDYFEAAGLDSSEFESSPPEWQVPMPSDERLAWVRQADSEIAVPLRIEAGVLGALPYLALEPYLRRFLPHTMISWSRLLRGEFRDSRVARDVL